MAMTIKEQAKTGLIPNIVEQCARHEKVSAEELTKNLGDGLVAIPCNKRSKLAQPFAVGKGVSTKINANIGTSKDRPDIEPELEKLKVALQAGADAVMDLSTGGDLKEIRQSIKELCPVPLGTVPIYQVAVEAIEQKKRKIREMDVDHMLKVIEEQAIEGVDFMTLHCGLTLGAIERLCAKKRLMGVVSRGGSLLMEWMLYHKQENPLYERYDDILAIAKEHEVTLSLGDGLRPGCLADATDGAQIHELIILGELTLRAWEKGVQVIIEGPGHVPLNQVVSNMQIQKQLCYGAPFYVLGPLVTDIAPGYDHITSAIGGAIAASAGADFLCYVTPAEHLRLPNLEDVKEGVIASKIAAHAADIVKGIPGAIEKDIEMAKARHALDWEKQIALAINPDKARAFWEESKKDGQPSACTMCGEYCAVKTYGRAMDCLHEKK